MKKSLIIIFWSLVSVFLIIGAQIFIPAFGDLFRGPIFLLFFLIFFLLGLRLLFLIKKENLEGKEKKFLLLTGFSAVGFFPSVILHNFFYALGIVASNIIIVKYLMEVLGVLFFLVAIFVCPLFFLIGAVKTISFLGKAKKFEESP